MVSKRWLESERKVSRHKLIPCSLAPQRCLCSCLLLPPGSQHRPPSFNSDSVIVTQCLWLPRRLPNSGVPMHDPQSSVTAKRGRDTTGLPM
ncbi:hypothetical protein AAFF_G00278980 [Aldrovandia affinis]|uniref:Uncharacterized protein n=1 Tax=Aldrovandia affinis TaxID=143900 RepID=A0AAD7WT27_9TELE|nr:hypothetical protein AAFF_G00278980 [Aldrovandia affinis]